MAKIDNIVVAQAHTAFAGTTRHTFFVVSRSMYTDRTIAWNMGVSSQSQAYEVVSIAKDAAASVAKVMRPVT